MAQIGRRNPTKLRIDLGDTSHSSSTFDSTLGGSNDLNDTWRQDLARIVTDHASQQRTDVNWGGERNELRPEDLQQVQKLGSGNAGVVWKVKHQPTGRIMAKKVINVETEPQQRRQIIRELSILKICESPHIVSFYGAFMDDINGSVVICMEYCEGGSFEDIYKRAHELHGVIGETVLARLAESVCKGLVYLHSKSVIHRDIKPSNVLMTKKGEIKLCDLGVSGELINSIADTFLGTQYYMAPERIQGSKYSMQSDIWSLGLTIIEVAQNQPALPPPGQSRLAPFELLDIIVNQPLPTLNSDRSEACRDFVTQCLIKNPKDRPGPMVMLNHPFIQECKGGSEQELATWLKEVWDWK